MGLWREILHPRDSKGRFVRKASVGVRVSTRSASVTVGKRYPIVPGKVNVYGGVLLRVERANAGNGIVDRWIDQAQSRVVSAIPEGTLRNVAQSLSEGQKVRSNGLTISGSGIRPQSPQLRINRSSSYTKNEGDRAPRRKPRTRSAARAGGHTQTTNDPGYSSIVGEQLARGREATTGSGVRFNTPQQPVVSRPREGVVTVTRTVGRTKADSELSAEALLFRQKAQRGEIVAKTPSTKKVAK